MFGHFRVLYERQGVSYVDLRNCNGRVYPKGKSILKLLCYKITHAFRASVIFRVKMEVSIGVLLEQMSSQLIERLRLSSSILDADDVGALYVCTYPQQLNIQKSFHTPNFRVS